MRNEFNYRCENPVKIRSCPYLNNIVEQDHRRVKFRIQPMLGFRTFSNARQVLIGIELMQKICQGAVPSSRSFRSQLRSNLADRPRLVGCIYLLLQQSP